MKAGGRWAAATVASGVALAAVAALRMPVPGGGAHAPRAPAPTPVLTQHQARAVHEPRVLHEPQAEPGQPTADDATPHDQPPLTSWDLMGAIERSSAPRMTWTATGSSRSYCPR